jgi:hypothetical protein
MKPAAIKANPMISEIAGTFSEIRYRVVLAGVGIVYDGEDLTDAIQLFRLFFTLGCTVELSRITTP